VCKFEERKIEKEEKAWRRRRRKERKRLSLWEEI
jgi:hypothetical protein